MIDPGRISRHKNRVPGSFTATHRHPEPQWLGRSSNRSPMWAVFCRVIFSDLSGLSSPSREPGIVNPNSYRQAGFPPCKRVRLAIRDIILRIVKIGEKNAPNWPVLCLPVPAIRG